MKSLWNKRMFGLLAALAVAVCPPVAGAQALGGATPVPTVRGPIPVTADSYPEMAAERIQERVDLGAAGYVEEEFFLSGAGNVYDWAADGSLSALSSGVPYTTRILVRRPAEQDRFSGNVIVELVNNTRAYDWAFFWGLSYPHILESGDAFVGVTWRPRGLDPLKMFNPTRYDPLFFGQPNDPCPAGGGAVDRREDLRWDVISQVGALLKSGDSSGALAGFDVERVYVTAHDGDLSTYINAVHSHANLANGNSVYDGYIIKGNGYPTRINACASAPGLDDPRRVDHGANVPVIRMLNEGDVLRAYNMRREDSDTPGDLYRLYEVAGSSHMDAAYYRHMPIPEDQVASGQPAFLSSWPLAYACDIDIPMQDHPIFRYAAAATLENIDRWVREGVPAPRAGRVRVSDGGTDRAAFVKDEFGNAVGGVRSPYLDVPAATFHAKTPGRAICGNLLYIEPFDWARLEALYGSSEEYAAKVAEAVERSVEQRWLTPSDGEKIKQEAIAPASSK